MRIVSWLLIAMFLAGCATGGQGSDRPLLFVPYVRKPVPVIAAIAERSPYYGNIAIGTVSNREGDISAFGRIFLRHETDSDELEEQLTTSLDNFGFRAKPAETAQYELSAEIVSQGLTGRTLSSPNTMVIAYRLVTRATGTEILAKEIMTTNRTLSAVTPGPERVWLTISQQMEHRVTVAQRQNIAKLIEHLLSIDSPAS